MKTVEEGKVVCICDYCQKKLSLSHAKELRKWISLENLTSIYFNTLTIELPKHFDGSIPSRDFCNIRHLTKFFKNTLKEK
jgi:hypothetical protein